MLDLRTYRAKSLAEALRLVREDLGPDASLLHTRRIGSATLPWLLGGQVVEVTASCEVQAPARLGERQHDPPSLRADLLDFRSRFRRHVQQECAGQGTSVEDLAAHTLLQTEIANTNPSIHERPSSR